MAITEQLITKVVDGTTPTIEATVRQVGSEGAVLVMQDGVATADGQDAIVDAISESLTFVDKDAGSTYTYYGFKEYNGTKWKIIRKDNSTGSMRYSYGDSGYDWSSRASLSYDYPPDA